MDQASRSASVERRNSYRGGDRRDSRDEQRPKSRSRSNERRSPLPNKAGNVLYIGNLDRRINEDEVRERFEKYGKVENVQLIKDPQTQECRGFAFVDFANYDDAEEAIKELDQKEINGRKIRVERSKRGIGYSRTPGQYLGNSRSGFGGGRRGDRGGYRDRGDRDYRDSRRFSRSRSNERHERRRDYGGDRDGGRRDNYHGGDRYNNRDRYNDRPPRQFRERSRSRERRY